VSTVEELDAPFDGDVFDRIRTETARTCATEGCENELPEKSSHFRKYCDEHMVARPKSRDKAPRSVSINLPRQPVTKKARDSERVAQAMLGYLGIMEGLFRAANDDVCADAVKRAAPGLAQAVGSLAEYHPVLVKVLAPLKATGEATAWLMAVVAVGPLVLTVLAHHELIDKTLAERLGVVAAASTSFAASAAE
jgi:hypothetical protein